jgi:hypothetical protein
MEDHSHLVKERGEGEHKTLLGGPDTKPEEARELLDKMKHVAKLIE